MRGVFKAGVLAIGCLAFLSADNVQAAQGGEANRLGVGVLLGEPIGLSGKYWLSSQSAVDAAFAWITSTPKDHFQFHSDYLFHIPLHIRDLSGRLPVYVGLGGRIVAEDDPVFGIRIPVGAEYLFSQAPIGIFAEIVPVIDLTPDTDSDLNGGVGLRFYF